MDFDTSNWEEVLIELEPSGKAPKKYGEGVYRFSASITLSVIMPRRGWDLIKKTKNYVYLKPPSHLGKPPFELIIKIPSKAQSLEIAHSCFKEAESWGGQLGEWPAVYLHEYPNVMNEILPSSDGSGLIEKPVYAGPPESSLFIGEFGLWTIELRKTDGEFSFHEHGRIKKDNNVYQVLPPLLEGQALSIEQSKYERNPIARKKCIKHFGAVCQVCSINFGEAYGLIGDGFIHVHHIALISEQEGEYEVNPITDLVPLCPNCHAMAHRRNPPYTVAELNKIYQAE